MDPNLAQCSIRIVPSKDNKIDTETGNDHDLVVIQPDTHDAPSPETPLLLSSTTVNDTIPEIRMQWIKAITELFLGPSKALRSRVRDFDLTLHPDGTVTNGSPPTSDSTCTPQLRMYPARYRIPEAVVGRIGMVEEKVKRTELFALGCVLYEVLSGKRIFEELGEEEVQGRYARGEFPDDVWGMGKAVRVLACWCPDVAWELLEAKGSDPLRVKFVKYIQKHPVLFGFQLLGGLASLASLITLPVLGTIGFGALGPAAGSAAAGWQASHGIVEAGSLLAWCQSAAMGGAAVGGILATGFGGAGVAVGATVAGALDVGAGEERVPELKERFLKAWRAQMVGEGKQIEGGDKEKEEVKPKLDIRGRIMQTLKLSNDKLSAFLPGKL